MQCQTTLYKKTRLALHPMLAAKDLLDDKEWVLDLIRMGYKATSEILDLTDIDISISLDDGWLIIPEYGFGAITYSKNSIGMSFDSNNINKHVFEKELPSLAAHELSHTFQLNHHPVKNWDERTLQEDILAEGSAQVFQHQLFSDSSLYVNDEVVRDREKWMSEIKPLLLKTRNDYDRAGYMYGGEETGIPRWVGYTLGYLICSEMPGSIK